MCAITLIHRDFFLLILTILLKQRFSIFTGIPFARHKAILYFGKYLTNEYRLVILKDYVGQAQQQYNAHITLQYF